MILFCLKYKLEKTVFFSSKNCVEKQMGIKFIYLCFDWSELGEGLAVQVLVLLGSVGCLREGLQIQQFCETGLFSGRS